MSALTQDLVLDGWRSIGTSLVEAVDALIAVGLRLVLGWARAAERGGPPTTSGRVGVTGMSLWWGLTGAT